MRARSLAVLGAALSALAVAVACGLETRGLLAGGSDASIDGPSSLDGTLPLSDATVGNADAPAGDDAPTAGDDGNAGDDGGSKDDGDAADALDAFDAGPCHGVVCNGACLDASTCVACDGSPLYCASNGACGSSCSACSGLPIQCFDCNSSRTKPVATCQVPDASAYCLNGDIYPRYHCGCPDDDAGQCPGATQTCTQLDIVTGNVCRTCGEANTDQALCKGGGTCNEGTARCLL